MMWIDFREFEHRVMSYVFEMSQTFCFVYATQIPSGNTILFLMRILAINIKNVDSLLYVSTWSNVMDVIIPLLPQQRVHH